MLLAVQIAGLSFLVVLLTHGNVPLSDCGYGPIMYGPKYVWAQRLGIVGVTHGSVGLSRLCGHGMRCLIVKCQSRIIPRAVMHNVTNLDSM
jgi:hypothetical protein